jgi:16S rRNA (guanine527-N7)-methyltransferase
MVRPNAHTERLLRDQCQMPNEALDRLKIYVRMLGEWQKTINLVSPTTLPEIWERHILDSAQIWPVIQNLSVGSSIVDLGSGGGLPALVLAMMGAEHVTMVESDARKCVFLREVSRETSLTNVTVVNKRIEVANDIKAPIVTARALAPLLQLVGWARPFIEANGTMIFSKGQNYQAEIDQLNEEFEDDFVGNIQTIQSITDAEARLVLVRSAA